MNQHLRCWSFSDDADSLMSSCVSLLLCTLTVSFDVSVVLAIGFAPQLSRMRAGINAIQGYSSLLLQLSHILSPQSCALKQHGPI